MEWEQVGAHKRLTFFQVTGGGTAINVCYDERRHEAYSVWTEDRSRARRYVTRDQAEDAIKSAVAGMTGAPAYDIHVLDPWEEKQNRRRYVVRCWTREDAEKRMAETLAPNAVNNVSRSHVQAHIEEVTAPEYVVFH